jgi:ATP-dependent RNA circularization protein (DNA/RNA ligase family)
MTDFFRFPQTPHLTWLGEGSPRGDKVLSPAEARAVLDGAVVVEEKVDGANLGFSVDEHGSLRAQNRGSFLDLGNLQGQWKPLRRWLAEHGETLTDALFPDLMLFGEWCYARHSVPYTALPDWFLAFDVHDRAEGVFWSTSRRNQLMNALGLARVPELGRGLQVLASLRVLLGCSALAEGPPEGLYVRREDESRLHSRAKLVRPEFVQAIEEHWSRRAIEPNTLRQERRED